jgi:hypothetical protein
MLLVKGLVRGVVELAILGGVLFGVAGRVDWIAAWLITLVFTGGSQRMVAVSS